MAHSNSSLNAFASCMARYEHNYILHTPPCKPISPHLTFGVMAHEVLYKAGLLRDEVADGIVDAEQYQTISPSEVLYPELKQEFQIHSWDRYFKNVIRQTAMYEKQLIDELASTCEDVTVEREVKLHLSVEQIKELGYFVDQPLVGIIDLLIRTPRSAIIIDYKFSGNRKSQDDFDMNSQLPIYATLVSKTYGINLRDIKYGYIDIPKQDFGKPALLSNGTLSRAKSQNISQELYEASVLAIHGDDDKYNCKPGGYYYDAWCSFANNRPAYLTIQWADLEVIEYVCKDILQAAVITDKFRREKLPFLKKYDAHTCKSCEYLTACKPWLEVGTK